MDPNATLQALRDLVQHTQTSDIAHINHEDCADRFADLFDGLDQWIMRGGFLPINWSKSQK